MQIRAQLFHRQVALRVMLPDILLGRFHRLSRRIRLTAADQRAEPQIALRTPALQFLQTGQRGVLNG